MSEEYDLSGMWSGIYNYPEHHPPNTFEATIRDHGGAIAGEIVEPNPEWGGQMVHAMLEGTRSGTSVRFTKIYDDLEIGPRPILYSGTIMPGGDEIEGRWEIPRVWSGTFMMVRGSRASESIARKVTEKIEL